MSKSTNPKEVNSPRGMSGHHLDSRSLNNSVFKTKTTDRTGHQIPPISKDQSKK